MQKVGVSILLLFGMLNIVPPLFSEGGTFDVTYKIVNECGDLVTCHGLYFDNAYFTILYLGISYVCFIVPFVFKTHKYINRLAFMLCAWNISMFIIEILNIFSPVGIYNEAGLTDNATYTYYTLFFTLGLASIITHETWIKQKKLDK